MDGPPDASFLFLSPVGLAIEDIAAAHRVWHHAVAGAIGTRLSLWSNAIWT